MALLSTYIDSEIDGDTSRQCELMDDLCADMGGFRSGNKLNPNSGNDIVAWLIPKPE